MSFLDMSAALLLAGTAGLFPAGCRLSTFSELRPAATAPHRQAAAAATVREVLGGAAAPPLPSHVFLDPASFVPGSLGGRAPAWREICAGAGAAGERALRWIEEGVRLEEFAAPFHGTFKGVRYGGERAPPRRAFPNHPVATSPEFVGFVRSEIAAGVAQGGMRCVGAVGAVEPPTVLLPLGVEPGKPRLIIDARLTNRFQLPPKFAFDKLLDVQRASTPESLLTVWDHKSGYFHVPLHPDTQPYLGFEFEGRYYVYTVLPFGWNVSPYVYQTLSRLVSAYLRRLGIPDFAYLDDSATVSGRLVAAGHAYVKGLLLTWLGYYVNLDKSNMVPAPAQKWLGFIIDLAARTYRVPEAKLAKLLALLADALGSARISVPALRSLAGKCVAMAPAVPGALLYTRALFHALAEADKAGAEWVPLPAGSPAREELGVWAGLRGWHGTRQWRSERHLHVRVGSDASGSRWGGWFMLPGAAQPVLVGDAWSTEQAAWDIGTLEMLGGAFTIASMPPWVRDCVVVLEGDNQAMVALLRSGKASRSGVALLAAQKVMFQLAMERNLDVDASWLCSEDNALADRISRLPLTGEGRLRRDLFLSLQGRFGAFSLDAMAGSANAQCARYVSRFATPATVGYDIFSFPLGLEALVYAFPPAGVVGAFLAYMREVSARGVVVMERDLAAPWWAVVAQLPTHVVLARAGARGAVTFPGRLAVSLPPPLALDLVAVLCDFGRRRRRRSLLGR